MKTDAKKHRRIRSSTDWEFSKMLVQQPESRATKFQQSQQQNFEDDRRSVSFAANLEGVKREGKECLHTNTLVSENSARKESGTTNYDTSKEFIIDDLSAIIEESGPILPRTALSQKSFLGFTPFFNLKPKTIVSKEGPFGQVLSSLNHVHTESSFGSARDNMLGEAFGTGDKSHQDSSFGLKLPLPGKDQKDSKEVSPKGKPDPKREDHISKAPPSNDAVCRILERPQYMLTLNRIVEEHDEKRNSMTNISTPIIEESPTFSKVKSISQSSNGSMQIRALSNHRQEGFQGSHSGQEDGGFISASQTPKNFSQAKKSHFPSRSTNNPGSSNNNVVMVYERKNSDSFSSDFNNGFIIPQKAQGGASPKNMKTQPSQFQKAKGKPQNELSPNPGNSSTGNNSLKGPGKLTQVSQHHKTKTWTEFDYKQLLPTQKQSKTPNALSQNEAKAIPNHKRFASELVNLKTSCFCKQELVKAQDNLKSSPKNKETEPEMSQLALKMSQMEKKMGKMFEKMSRVETENQFLRNKVDILSKQTDLSQMVKTSFDFQFWNLSLFGKADDQRQ